jgi:hypothetical protein
MGGGLVVFWGWNVERLVGGYFILDVWRGWVLIMDDIFD